MNVCVCVCDVVQGEDCLCLSIDGYVCITEAHGATDVTGFGILGHAQNLVACQKNSVNFSLHTLPSKL